MTKKRRCITLGDETWEKLRSLARKEEKSMSELLREAAWDLFEKRRGRQYDPKRDRYTEKI